MWRSLLIFIIIYIAFGDGSATGDRVKLKNPGEGASAENANLLEAIKTGFEILRDIFRRFFKAKIGVKFDFDIDTGLKNSTKAGSSSKPKSQTSLKATREIKKRELLGGETNEKSANILDVMKTGLDILRTGVQSYFKGKAGGAFVLDFSSDPFGSRGKEMSKNSATSNLDSSNKQGSQISSNGQSSNEKTRTQTGRRRRFIDSLDEAGTKKDSEAGERFKRLFLSGGGIPNLMQPFKTGFDTVRECMLGLMSGKMCLS